MSGCVSEMAGRFAQANVANNRRRIRSQIRATIRCAIRRDSQLIIGSDHTVIVRSISWFHLSAFE